MKKFIIFGAGGFISCIFDLIHAQDGKVYKIYQNVPEIIKEGKLSLQDRVNLLGYNVEIFDSLNSFQLEDNCHYVLGFVTVQKYKLVSELKEKYGITLSNLIHPTAFIGPNVYIGEGVNILPRVIVDANAYLDDFCTLNKGSIVGHEVKVGKFSLISPGTILAGGTKIGTHCLLGMNTSIIEGREIGDCSIIGAGSMVNKNIKEGSIAYGNPAKVIRENDMKDFNNYKKK